MGGVSIGRSRRILVAAVVVIMLVVLMTGALDIRILPYRRLEPS
ncbi:hypothetical protein [Streptosporangium amethystogenes]|nr:hypothetical protein [Streptosporangium amethystogenes]